ncbi:MAG TPA: hypothetical protein VFB12_09125 [Ktedonobacteraceae bacterium]|nr:hypothetical protein [Ktedonobacteraceae bacterium]
MCNNKADVKSAAKRGLWSKVAFALLIALLVLGGVGGSTAFARTSAPRQSATVSGQQSDAAPVMEAYNGLRYIGWTGRNAAHNLNLMTYDPATRSFGQAQVLTDTTLVGSGPSLANFYGNLYVAWQGTDHRLNIGRYNLAHPAVLAKKVTLNEYTNDAPAMTGFRDRLYLSWRGTDGHLNLISSVDGSIFGSKVTYGIPIRTSPSLAGADMYLLVFWQDLSASSHIVVGRYDPMQPANLSAVVTLASTSQLPVGVAQAGVPAPYARVAWRTAGDAHIRLAIFEGGQFLHNPVYMTETTRYTPTLFDGASLCWTGTDAAQSIHVSAVNL